MTTGGGGGQQPKILQVGDIHTGYGSSGTVYSPLGSCGTVLAGHDQPKIVEKHPGAIRGRYDKEGRIVQTLELGKTEVCHTLTSVQKTTSFWYAKRRKRI